MTVSHTATVLPVTHTDFVQARKKKAPEAKCLSSNCPKKKFNNQIFVFLYLQFSLCKCGAVKVSETEACQYVTVNSCGLRFHGMLRIKVFIVMPRCHPGLLFYIFPVTVSRVYRSLLPSDPNCAVTGNLFFISGTLKKATPLFLCIWCQFLFF